MLGKYARSNAGHHLSVLETQLKPNEKEREQMKASLRKRLNYGNVIATIALFVALGGAAVAAGLPKNSVGPNQIKRGAVSTPKLKNRAVTSAKLGNKAVTAGKLAPNSVTPGNIGNGAVTSAKIGNGAVIAASIKNGVVTTNKLQNEAVTAAKLGKGSVTLSKLGDDVAPLLGTLKSGQTLRGVFYIAGTAAEDKLLSDSITFQFPISGSAPAVSVLKKGQTNANCAGIGSGSAPSATAGNLCVYLTEEVNLDVLSVENNTRLGFGLAAKADTANDVVVYGQWAVTAP
jgi:hypothetical protein